MVEPNGVLDDGYRETVAVRLGVGHGRAAYPDPVKATQPWKRVLVDVHLSSTVPLSGTVSWRRHDDPRTVSRTAQPPGP